MTTHEGDVEKRILNAAKALFAEKGHEKTRLREIASNARTSESQIIKYFHSKNGVLDALINKAVKHIVDSLQQLQSQNDNPLSLIRSVPSILLKLKKNDSALLIVYLFSRQFYALVPEEQNLLESNLIKEVSVIFKRGQKKGIFSRGFNPEIASLAFWGTVTHLVKNTFYTEKKGFGPRFSQKEMTNCINMFISSFMKKK